MKSLLNELNQDAAVDNDPATRISRLEKALDLDERVSRIESRFRPTGGRGWIVATVAILAAVLPFMQWIDGFLKTQRELAVVESKAKHETQKEWLDVIIRQGLPPEEKQRVLSFLSEIVQDTGIRKWAKEQLEKANREVEALTKAKQALSAANQIIEKLRSQGATRERELSGKLASAEREKVDAQRRIDELQKESIRLPPRLIDAYIGCQLITDRERRLECVDKFGQQLFKEVSWTLNYPAPK